MGSYYHDVHFAQRYHVQMAEVITSEGFCYSFNIVEPEKLLNLEEFENFKIIVIMILFGFSSVASVFNYSRPVYFQTVIKKNDVITIKNNDSYPWKTQEKHLGLYVKHALLTTRTKKFESHDSYKYYGMHYQFHNPLEMPSRGDRRFISKPQTTTTFEIDVDITDLGENLLDYRVERFRNLLEFFPQN
jgi:hypothetical protein